MERLTINGIDFDKKLDELKVRLHDRIEVHFELVEYWDYFKYLGIVMTRVSGIPKSPHV